VSAFFALFRLKNRETDSKYYSMNHISKAQQEKKLRFKQNFI